MTDFVEGDLTIRVDDAGGAAVRLEWLGRGKIRDAGKRLAPVFSECLSTAEAAGVDLELRFETLSMINSSTITALIGFIQNARSRGIAMTIVYDAAQKWQRVSFDALRVLEKGDGLLRFRAAEPARP
jgi:hypothetical protein